MELVMLADLPEGLDVNRVIEALLNWPALLAALLAAVVALYRRDFGELLGRGDISISWGDGRSIQLRDLSAHLDQDLQPVQDDLKGIRQELEQIRGKLQELEATAVGPVSFSVGGDDRSGAELSSVGPRQARPLKNVLTSRWRSLDSIVADAGISKPKALEELEELQADGVAESTIDRAGRRIAKRRGG